MPATTLFIIRHAEKPEPDNDPPGLTPEGQPDVRSLLVAGWQRAGAWAALFGSALDPRFPVPATIYAAAPEATDPDDDPPSRRPAETVTPLSQKLGLPLRDRWQQGQEKAMLAEALQQPSPILICWEHKLIVKAILPILLTGQDGTDRPRHWDRARFDVVLRLDRPDAAAPWTLTQLLPQLMAGDPATPL